MRAQLYWLAAVLALLGACGDPTGPDVSGIGTDSSRGVLVPSPNMDPVSLNSGR